MSNNRRWHYVVTFVQKIHILVLVRLLSWLINNWSHLSIVDVWYLSPILIWTSVNPSFRKLLKFPSKTLDLPSNSADTSTELNHQLLISFLFMCKLKVRFKDNKNMMEFFLLSLHFPQFIYSMLHTLTLLLWSTINYLSISPNTILDSKNGL